jgi:pilus assembly protein CpaB
MKSKSIFLIAVSLGFGLVAAVGITQVMGRNKTEPVVAVPKHPVLVAVQDLDINTELAPEMFVEEQWPLEYIPEGVVTSVEEIEGKVVTARVGKNGTVFLSNLVNKSEIREKQIPAGYKVFGIQLGSDDHLYGLLEPGDLVDLIAVFRNSKQTGPSSLTFLRKVRIFSIGSHTSKDPDNRAGVKGNTVVGLLVTERQSEQIALVNKVADLKLAMRSDQESEDELTANSSGTNLHDLLGTGDSSSAVIAETNALAQMLSDSFAEVEAADGQGTGAPSQGWTMVVYTSEGPTQYRFNQDGGNVPERIEGFQSGAEATTEDPSADVPPEDEPAPADFDGGETGDESGFSTDDLDSEPGA